MSIYTPAELSARYRSMGYDGIAAVIDDDEGIFEAELLVLEFPSETSREVEIEIENPYRFFLAVLERYDEETATSPSKTASLQMTLFAADAMCRDYFEVRYSSLNSKSN